MGINCDIDGIALNSGDSQYARQGGVLRVPETDFVIYFEINLAFWVNFPIGIQRLQGQLDFRGARRRLYRLDFEFIPGLKSLNGVVEYKAQRRQFYLKVSA